MTPALSPHEAICRIYNAVYALDELSLILEGSKEDRLTSTLRIISEYTEDAAKVLHPTVITLRDEKEEKRVRDLLEAGKSKTK